MSRYYEESQYYVKEYERRNGLERDMIEKDFRSRGTPFETDLSPEFRQLRDFSIPLSRIYDDWDTRRPFRTSFDNRRQRSLPPRRTYQSTVAPHQPPPSILLPEAPLPTTHSRHYSETLQRSNYASSTYQPQSAVVPAISRPPPLDTSLTAHRSHFPVTSNSRPGSPQPVASAGDIINTENGFVIQLDVKHFHPRDIKVSLIGNNLSITGEHIDDDANAAQSLKRSFSRRYAIPEDIRLDTIKSHMTDAGVLVVSVSLAPEDYRTENPKNFDPMNFDPNILTQRIENPKDI
uniref:SHSP domain-containing protein n=1 Tax=Panagrellus redivivus TaxID=6233 RepID=A0A7E5A1G5_PANRE